MKSLSSYDLDVKLCIDALISSPYCNGRVGATGMCLGGHLAFRAAAIDSRILANVCYFPTDIHSNTLGFKPRAREEKETLDLITNIQGESVLIFGKVDPHVPLEGRRIIHDKCVQAGIDFTWLEISKADHAFIRDELSKGMICF
jgi:carboxymethylenebutenolidase